MFTYRDLKILDYVWHIPHFYELSKLGAKFFVFDKFRKWDWNKRPLPPNAILIDDYREFMPYDLVILHLDQLQLYNPPEEFKLFSQLPYPKVCIFHGDTQIEEKKELLKKLTKDMFVVFNSKRAYENFKIENSEFILHGFSPEEWLQTTYKIDDCVLNLTSFIEHSEFIPDLSDFYGKDIYDYVKREIKIERFKAPNFSKYRLLLSQYSIYFNPTRFSPNPRARAEAMLSGLCVVTTGFVGEEEFIENGKTGFIVNDKKKMVDLLKELLHNKELVIKIGKEARKTASKLLHINNFLEKWKKIIKIVLNY